MNRIVKPLFFISLLGALLAAPGLAQTINAASCNSSDVQTALNSVAADGTTVNVPAGTCTWTVSVAYNQTFSTTIVGAGNTTGADSLGNPTGYSDQTIIQDLVSNSSSQTFIINSAANKNFRMTGMSFLFASSQTTARNSGVVGVNGNSHSIRIDHNHFVGGICCRMVNVGGANAWGVMDHNLWEEQNGTNVNLIEVNGSNWNGTADPWGDASWNDLSYFGSNKFMFIENNTIRATGSSGIGSNVDIQAGARAVFRYNTWTNVALQTHGIGHNTRDRGPRAWEVYKNSFTYPGFGGYYTVTDYEGGTSLYWGNTIGTGYSSNFIREDYRRATGDTYVQTAPPNGWGYCGTTHGPSLWDQNLDATGQACLDGVGRGKGDLLTGNSWPNVTSILAAVQTWLNQARDPQYVWANTFGGTTYYAHDSATVENRDYFLELPNTNESATFNGTAGIGHGTLAPTVSGAYTNAPNCSGATYPGPGYWSTTSNTLYVCTAVNTWTSYYTPYTYPHPLTGSSSMTWGSMDAWLQMNTSTPGTTLTPTIEANGTVSGTSFTWNTCVGSGSCSNTTSSSFTIGVSQGGLGGSIVVNGTTYPDGTPTQSLALAPGTSFTWAATFSNPGGHLQAVANGYYVPGSSITNNMDLVGLWGTNGDWAVMQAQSSGGVAIETGSPTQRSSVISLTAGRRYAFSLLYDETNGQGKLAIFDPANNYAQVGTTQTSAMPTGNALGHITIGNSEVGTASSIVYFEDLMLDWTNHVFPNAPHLTQGSATVAPPTGLSAAVQ